MQGGYTRWLGICNSLHDSFTLLGVDMKKQFNIWKLSHERRIEYLLFKQEIRERFTFMTGYFINFLLVLMFGGLVLYFLSDNLNFDFAFLTISNKSSIISAIAL